ncbi:MAG: DUF763 domain-containing protein [Armatimonadota bacterium]
MRTGTAKLPLHSGSAPAWLFSRMSRLAREIVSLMVIEFGPLEVLKKLSDPYWFQALGCVLGFDWHSSGLTTTTTGAIKEGIKDLQTELGLFVCGGKGATSRRTPDEIREDAGRHALNIDAEKLVYASRMTAKVDSSAVQDGYQIYHHAFFFDKDGNWAVVQQGMNELTGMARRYHWLSSEMESFVVEPHTGVKSEEIASDVVLNMVAREAEENRKISAEIASEKPEKAIREIKKIRELELPRRHNVCIDDISPHYLEKILARTYERQPENFEQLLGIEGVGAKTIRALAMIGDLVYGAPVSRRDPAVYSFAHGGKDGTPYPVDRRGYDRSIEIVKKAVQRAKLGYTEAAEAIKRLARFYEF